MKKLLVFLFILCSVSVSAQDVIVKKDGSTVVCRVEKVGETDVTYKLWSDLKGSSYVMDKSLVSAINYENGTKTNFDGATEAAQAEMTKPMTDDELLRMASPTKVKKTLTPEQTNRKIKRLKRVGWIVGGTCVAGGAALIALGIIGEDDHSYYDSGISWSMAAPGMILVAGGIATTTGCLIRAHNLKQKSPYSVNASPLYRQEFRLRNGASLATGVDLLKDNTRHNPSLGLGLSYNF